MNSKVDEYGLILELADEFIFESNSTDENIFDLINSQAAEIIEDDRANNDNDKRQKFDSADYEIQKHKFDK